MRRKAGNHAAELRDSILHRQHDSRSPIQILTQIQIGVNPDPDHVTQIRYKVRGPPSTLPT